MPSRAELEKLKANYSIRALGRGGRKPYKTTTRGPLTERERGVIRVSDQLTFTEMVMESGAVQRAQQDVPWEAAGTDLKEL